MLKGKKLLCSALLLISSQCHPASLASAPNFLKRADALGVQNKQWAVFVLQGHLPNHWGYWLEGQSRLDFDFDRVEEELLRTAINYQLTSKVSLWFGEELNSRNFITNRRPIHILWEQLQWVIMDKTQLKFTSRSRLQQRNLVNELQWNDRFRQQIRMDATKFFANKYTPVIWDEIFLNCNTPVWVNNKIVDQNRFYVGLNVPVTKYTSMDMGYLNQYIIRDTSDQMNHVVYLGFNIRPDAA